MLTYEEARSMMERARNGRRKLENNTWLERRTTNAPKDRTYKSAYAVRLHDTDVVTLHPDGSYTLNSGGWRTVTTKDRINRYAPGVISSDRGTWYYYPKLGRWDLKFPFADGMRVWANGQVEGVGLDESAIRRDILKQIRVYIDGFAAHVVKHGLADPGPGDCWGCYMVPAGDGNGKLPVRMAPWGQDRATKPGTDHVMGLDHIFEHFREKYYVPSLAWRAVQRRGDPAFVYRMIQIEVGRRDTRTFKADLRAYFKHLIPALVEYRVRELAAADSENESGVA